MIWYQAWQSCIQPSQRDTVRTRRRAKRMNIRNILVVSRVIWVSDTHGDADVTHVCACARCALYVATWCSSRHMSPPLVCIGRNKGCCIVCVSRCHLDKGHIVNPTSKLGVFYCDCGMCHVCRCMVMAANMFARSWHASALAACVECPCHVVFPSMLRRSQSESNTEMLRTG